MASPSMILIAIGVFVVILGVLAAATALARNPRSMQRDNPNLQPCRDCGEYISIRAATCPHCGAPIKGA